MITDLKKTLGAFTRNSVIKSRSGLEQDHRDSVNEIADEMRRRSEVGREYHERRKAADGEQNSQSVGDAIGDFFGF